MKGKKAQGTEQGQQVNEAQKAQKRKQRDQRDHDRLYKELIQTFFKEFMTLFFPEAVAHLDTSRLKFLSQELNHGVGRAGKRRVDLLVETAIKGEPSAVYIHLETQATEERGFPERMFLYYCKLYEKYRSRILPIAVFSHKGKAEEQRYAIRFPFADVLQFQFQKLELGHANWRTYLKQDNPVAAALLSVTGYTPQERVQVKREFLRMLVRLQLDEDKMVLLLVFFETYLKLEPKEEMALREELEKLSVQEAKEIYLLETTWGRKWYGKGIEEGRQKGKEEGRQEGRQEGEQVGVQKGKEEAQQAFILSMHREGLPTATIARIAGLAPEAIEQLIIEHKDETR